MTEFFLEEGLERARQLDEILKTTGKTVGPLHGVPVSIKNLIDVKGHDTPSSFSSWVGKMVAKEDAPLVAILRAAGAVFYCLTNLPQSCMHLETHSYMGRTLNPYNTALTPGGSSGGESALIAMKGSSFGVGSASPSISRLSPAYLLCPQLTLEGPSARPLQHAACTLSGQPHTAFLTAGCTAPAMVRRASCSLLARLRALPAT